MRNNIVGFQVVNFDGDHWGGRASYEVLSAEVALADLEDAQKNGEGLWLMSAVTHDCIEEPVFLPVQRTFSVTGRLDCGENETIVVVADTPEQAACELERQLRSDDDSDSDRGFYLEVVVESVGSAVRR